MWYTHGAEHEGDRHRARGQQPEEVLRGQVRGERPAVRGPVRAACPARCAHGGPGGDELQHLLAPGVHLHPQFHPDDAVRAEVIGLGPHPGHGQLPGVVHGLGQDLEFLVLRPAADLQPDVVDRRPDHEAERLEAASPSSTYSDTDRSEVNTPAGSAPAVWASRPSAASGSQLLSSAA